MKNLNPKVEVVKCYTVYHWEEYAIVYPEPDGCIGYVYQDTPYQDWYWKWWDYREDWNFEISDKQYKTMEGAKKALQCKDEDMKKIL